MRRGFVSAVLAVFSVAVVDKVVGAMPARLATALVLVVVCGRHGRCWYTTDARRCRVLGDEEEDNVKSTTHVRLNVCTYPILYSLLLPPLHLKLAMSFKVPMRKVLIPAGNGCFDSCACWENAVDGIGIRVEVCENDAVRCERKVVCEFHLHNAKLLQDSTSKSRLRPWHSRNCIMARAAARSTVGLRIADGT